MIVVVVAAAAASASAGSGGGGGGCERICVFCQCLRIVGKSVYQKYMSLP